ncbi:GNAT family N-acetyltransferase [Baia soyae]|uniref:GNAT family N-acetyltransferase n=1 Tax=Baia soyae TaxID=1544746 RepID=UPI001043017C|nr:GNAT family N-acetyltransferase [Baia soyae]
MDQDQGWVKIRDCKREDAEQIASFYNRFGYGTGPSGYPLKPGDILRLMDEREIVSYLLAEYEGSIIGTMLFSTLSGQKMPDPKAVWSGYFIIHPEFRNGGIPGRFFSESISRLTEKGYWYIDTEVDPTNRLAMALYKRVGMYKTSRSRLDYDGYIDLRCYLPYILQYVLSGYQSMLPEGIMENVGWKNLITSVTRSNETDSVVEHGVEMVPYTIQYGEMGVTCWIDIRSQKVTRMESPQFRFDSYIVEGQTLTIGQSIRIRFEFENRQESNILVQFQTHLGNQEVEYRNGQKIQLLDAGESIEWEETITLLGPLQGELKTRVQFGEAQFDFYSGVEVRSRVELRLPEQSLLLGESTTTYLRLQNLVPEPIRIQLEVKASGNKRLQAIFPEKDTWLIQSEEIVDIPLWLQGAGIGVGELVCDVISEQNKCIHTGHFQIPIHSKDGVIRYRRNGRVILENPSISVQIDSDTGGIYVYDQVSGKQVIQEAWPDLGFPYTSGVKRMANRSLQFNDESESTIVVKEMRENGSTLTRKISICSVRNVKIEDSTNSAGSLKIHPWCMLQDAVIHIPCMEGVRKDTIIYEEFPFMIHDFEYARDLQLPSDPQAYSMSWSAFENSEVTVGMVWKGQVESLLYGLRWMPAIVFASGASEQKMFPFISKRKRLKNIKESYKASAPRAVHYYVIARSGVEDIKRHWQMLVDRGKFSDPFTQQAEISLPIRHTSSVEKGEVRVEERNEASKYLYSIDNQAIQLKLLPEHQGAITSLKVQGKELLLQPQGSEKRGGRDGSPQRSGILLKPFNQPIDLENNALLDDHPFLSFQGKPISVAEKDGITWEGIRCSSEHFSLDCLLVPNIPLIRLDFHAFNRSRALQESYFAIQSLWNGFQEKRRSKSVHYWNALGHQVLDETGIRRKVYGEPRMVLELGSDLFAACWIPSYLGQLAVYELPKKGFQVSLIHPVKVGSGETKRYSTYFAIGHSVEEVCNYFRMGG